MVLQRDALARGVVAITKSAHTTFCTAIPDSALPHINLLRMQHRQYLCKASQEGHNVGMPQSTEQLSLVYDCILQFTATVSALRRQRNQHVVSQYKSSSCRKSMEELTQIKKVQEESLLGVIAICLPER